MKKITLFILSLSVLFVAAVSAKKTTNEDFMPKKATTVMNDDIIFVLDSMYTDYPDGAYERTYWYYNEKAKLILMEAHWWDSAGNIEGGVQYIKEYDANENITLDATYNWNVSTSDWITSDRSVREFDSKSNMTLEITSFGNGSNGWSDTKKAEMGYDSNKRMTSEIVSYDWSGSGTWARNTYTEYAYWNDTDKKTTAVSYNWDSGVGGWILSTKFSYSYDDDGNLLTEMTSIWWEGEWADGMLIEYGDYNEYGDYGTKKEKMFDDWDTMTWITNIDSSFEYTYDERGNQLTSIETRTTSSPYIMMYKYEYAYDKFNNLSLWSSYEKVSTAENWTGTNYFEYVYNDDNLWVDFFEYYWEAGAWEYARRNYITYDENNCMEYETGAYWDGEWIDFQWNHWFYGPFNPTAISKPGISPIKVYAADKTITVANNTKGEDIRVYDLRGQLFNTVLSPNSTETIHSQSGVYIVRVGKYAVKVVVR